MDANKLQVLTDIGYSIPVTCELCVHGLFGTWQQPFGSCTLHKYEHRKHTDNPRDLSVFRGGTCPLAQRRTSLPVVGEAYAPFVEET